MLPSGAGKLTAGKLDLSDLRSVKSFRRGIWLRQRAGSPDQQRGYLATPLGTTAQGLGTTDGDQSYRALLSNKALGATIGGVIGGAYTQHVVLRRRQLVALQKFRRLP